MLPDQADDGYLYPLEKAFFYVHKPPTLLVHAETESVEFMRQGGGVLAASAKTFDLAIRMKNDQVRALHRQAGGAAPLCRMATNAPLEGICAAWMSVDVISQG